MPATIAKRTTKKPPAGKKAAKNGTGGKSIKAPGAKTPNVKRILNVKPSPRQEEDWRPDNAAAAGLLAAAAAIPPSKDLRQSWWAVGDQGTTGACVGFATADSVLRWHYVKVGWITTNDLLSPRYVWMAAKETDPFTSPPTTFIETDGTSLKAALDIARKYGAVKDDVLPFTGKVLYTGEAQTFYAIAAQMKIASYFNLGRNIVNWRTWLANNGPILTRLDVDATWDAVDSTGWLDLYQPGTARGGHAVALVGYAPDRFIVRNSWGTSWGDKGFAYASIAYAQAAFTEAYGVTL